LGAEKDVAINPGGWFEDKTLGKNGDIARDRTGQNNIGGDNSDVAVNRTVYFDAFGCTENIPSYGAIDDDIFPGTEEITVDARVDDQGGSGNKKGVVDDFFRRNTNVFACFELKSVNGGNERKKSKKGSEKNEQAGCYFHLRAF